MINIIIVFDGDDDELGSYFRMCATDIHNTLVENHNDIFEITLITSDGLSIDNIQTVLRTKGELDYVFISFSHGSDSTLLRKNDSVAYVDMVSNNSHFNKAMVYTFACSAGLLLGPELIAAGSHAFWGYINSVEIVMLYDVEFMTCTNFGLKMFLSGYNLEDSFNMMQSKFLDIIYDVAERNSFASSQLLDAKRSLVLHGNRNLSLNDFIVA